MIKKSVSNLSLIGFMNLLLLLLFSAIALYINHYGFSVENLYEAYAGNEERYIAAKTFEGILKSFSPHIFAMPLMFFILFHIGVASRSFKQEHIKYIAMIGFSSALGDILVTFIISYGIVFAYIKILFMLAFELTLLYAIFTLAKKIYST
jgi:hypothetical protein